MKSYLYIFTVFPFFGLKNKSQKGRSHPGRCDVTAVTAATREGASRETKSRGSGRAERSAQVSTQGQNGLTSNHVAAFNSAPPQIGRAHV